MSRPVPAIAAPRRRSNDLIPAHTHVRVRNFTVAPPHSEHMRGWVEASMSRALPADASRDFRDGYAEGALHFLSIRTAYAASMPVLA